MDKSRAACRLARVPKWVSLSSYANDHRSEDEWRLLQQTMDDFLCKFSVVATDAVYQQLLNYAMGIYLCSYCIPAQVFQYLYEYSIIITFNF